MADISVVFQRKGEEPIELLGCDSVEVEGGRPTFTLSGMTRSKQFPSGRLMLRFAAGSPGAKELADRYAVDEGSSLTGRITVTEGGVTTDYGQCGYMARYGHVYEFVFACIKD